MASERGTLEAAPRERFGSRNTRRLRREGLVPGVVYSGGEQARPFQASARDALAVIAEGHALFDLKIEGAKEVPVVIKEQQHDPVRGDLQHLDLQQVELDVEIQADVMVELEGAEDAPGVKEGGVLEQTTHEVTVEALPANIPDRITVDVSAMEMHDTMTLAAVKPPSGVQFLAEDFEAVAIASLSPPRVEPEPEPEVEEETAVIGEEEEAAEGAEPGEESGESGEAGGSGGE